MLLDLSFAAIFCSLGVHEHSYSNLQITHMEMIKGIQGHGYYDELVVPIIENTAHEGELTESLSEAVNLLAQYLFVCLLFFF